METYRRPVNANPFEEDEEIDESELEVRICDGLLAVEDIQMATDVSKDNRIAVMFKDSSIVTVIGTIEEFEKKLK